jgi:hypothetical protein
MLGYKLPVIWPEDDWFVKDQAGPVKTSRRTKPKRTSRKPSRPRNGQSPAGREPRQTAASRQMEKLKNRPPNYFPGTFFGFAPAQDATQASATPEPNPERKAEPAKKKRRRWRRKKKSTSGKTETTAAAASEAPSGKQSSTEETAKGDNSPVTKTAE